MTAGEARLNPAELKIDLLCLGAREDGNGRIEEDARPCHRTRAQEDPGSGLEMILPGEIKELYVNVPVREKFVTGSPYSLVPTSQGCALIDERSRVNYPVMLAPRPAWLNRRTRGGTPMSQVGMLQGSVFSVTLGEPCVPGEEASLSCRFCRDGKPEAHQEPVSVADVAEVAGVAQRETGVTLVLLRGKYRHREELAAVLPYLKVLKQEVGILVALQLPVGFAPGFCEQARALGADHFSIDLGSSRVASSRGHLPDEVQTSDREGTLHLIRQCVREMGKGRVSSEIVAGVVPIAETLETVDLLVGAGALPLVRVFRAQRGMDIEDHPRPRYQEMLAVCRHVFEQCRDHHLPIGALPNFNLSVILHPQEALFLTASISEIRAYMDRIDAVQKWMHPYFTKRMRKGGTTSQQ